MGLMDKFADPSLFESLSFGEKMIGSTITMLMGMGITFLILMILWGFIAIMGKVMGQGVKKKTPAPAAAPVPATAPVSAPAEAAPVSDDAVIAAVIAAAVAAYQGSGGAGNLVVRKITRVSGGMTPWTSAGRDECIEQRRF